MKPKQKLVQGDTQVALFPMEYLRITQGRYNNFSHKGYNATDLAGKDGSAEKWYAPFDIKVEWLDVTTKTGVVISNTKRVLMANGKIAEPHTISIMLWHDNNISGLRVGQTYRQGDYFYMEGTAGMATGNHIHMELSYWKYDGSYPLFRLKNGYWTLKGRELNVEDLFFVNDTVIMDTKGYKFKKYTTPKPKPPVKPPTTEKEKYKVGDIVRFEKLATSSTANAKVVKASVKTGKIDKVYKNRTYPYRIASNIGFLNDKMIIGINTPILDNPRPQALKVGDRVLLSQNAKGYAVGGGIPNQYKGRWYTIQQLRPVNNPTEALLKELYSWVWVKDIRK